MQGDHSEFQICQKSVSRVTLATQRGVESGSSMLQLSSIPTSKSLDTSDWGNGCLGVCAVACSWCLKKPLDLQRSWKWVLRHKGTDVRADRSICIYYYTYIIYNMHIYNYIYIHVFT